MKTVFHIQIWIMTVYIFRTELGRPLYSRKAREIAPNNLPHFPGPFVGRDEDVNNIVHILLHSLVKSVHIVDLPVVGKSTLAVHVGYEMASRGVTVRYINVDETLTFKSRDLLISLNDLKYQTII